MIQIPIALQAYSLRKIYQENPLQALKLIKEAGYDGVEFYGTHFQTDLYVSLLRETGLVCAGWHTGIDALENDFDATLRRNLAVGNKYICVPWFKADTVPCGSPPDRSRGSFPCNRVRLPIPPVFRVFLFPFQTSLIKCVFLKTSPASS